MAGKVTGGQLKDGVDAANMELFLVVEVGQDPW